MNVRALLPLLAAPLLAEIKLPALISNGAVLQADAPLRIWGWADAGERVTVRLAGAEASATADAIGRWTAYLPPRQAGGPHELTVSGSNTITVRDVWTGEVWVASGQSNMAFNMGREMHRAAELPKATFPKIRFFQVAQKTSPYPLDDVAGEWKSATPDVAARWSAVAFYFARELHQQRRVAFGVIQSAVGGTPAEAWTSGAALTADPLFMPLLARWEGLMDDYPEARARFERAKERKAQPPPDPGHRWQPTGLYNGMIAPLTRYAIRGAIWYQGENNASRGNGALYGRLFETMIRDWRRAWGQGHFPFLWAQLPKFENKVPGATWPEVQEAQRHALALRNTGMAVTLDLGDLNDVHPTDKLNVGRRMARVARTVAYGENIVHSGPLFRQLTAESGKLRVWFDQTGGALKARGGDLVGFVVAGANGKFVRADARIDGATVVVSAPGIDSPVSVRYGWGGSGEGNLYNSEDIPASPFRASLK